MKVSSFEKLINIPNPMSVELYLKNLFKYAKLRGFEVSFIYSWILVSHVYTQRQQLNDERKKKIEN